MRPPKYPITHVLGAATHKICTQDKIGANIKRIGLAHCTTTRATTLQHPIVYTVRQPIYCIKTRDPLGNKCLALCSSRHIFILQTRTPSTPLQSRAAAQTQHVPNYVIYITLRAVKFSHTCTCTCTRVLSWNSTLRVRYPLIVRIDFPRHSVRFHKKLITFTPLELLPEGLRSLTLAR